MARESGKQAGEKIQIAVLTFAMTAGGFALLTLALAMKLNPDSAERVTTLESKSKLLVKLLDDPETRNLRWQAKQTEGQDSTKGLADIIFDAVRGRGLTQGNIPPARTQDTRGIRRIEQTVQLNPGKLSSIFGLVGDLKDSKKTIRIETVDVTRDRKAAEDEDSWTATLKIVDYVKLSP